MTILIADSQRIIFFYSAKVTTQPMLFIEAQRNEYFINDKAVFVLDEPRT